MAFSSCFPSAFKILHRNASSWETHPSNHQVDTSEARCLFHHPSFAAPQFHACHGLYGPVTPGRGPTSPPQVNEATRPELHTLFHTHTHLSSYVTLSSSRILGLRFIFFPTFLVYTDHSVRQLLFLLDFLLLFRSSQLLLMSLCSCLYFAPPVLLSPQHSILSPSFGLPHTPSFESFVPKQDST